MMQQSRPQNLRWVHVEYDVSGLSPEEAAEAILPSRPQITSSLEELSLLADGEPTVRMRALVLPKPPVRDTEPLPPLDSSGRPYLSYTSQWDAKGLFWDDTLYHVEGLVNQYRELSGEYPAEICLSANRYFLRKIDRFYPRLDNNDKVAARPIPFAWEAGNVGGYEILVRGKAK